MAVRRMTIDFDRERATIELSDGRVVPAPFPGEFRDTDPVFRRVVLDMEEGELKLTLPADDEAVLVIGRPFRSDEPDPAQIIVYLDQLHWVTLAQFRFAPEKVRESERDAAQHVLELAEERKIILPLSGAHLIETNALTGRHRRHLATTMLGLSRGWQMRSPVEIRGHEFRASLTGREPALAGVFTLEPHALFIDRPPRPTGGDDLAPGWRELNQRMVEALSIYSTIIEDEKLDSDEGRLMARNWAASHQALAQYMRTERTPREHVRINARARLLSDLAEELAKAAVAERIDDARFRHWVEHEFEADLERMPYLGRQYGVIHERLSNADDHWHENDLNDINFLACAAGYADLVVGERKTSEYLRRIETRVTPGAHVCRTLAAAVEHLEVVLVAA